MLLLGAPLDSLTLVHHAECVARAEPKRWVAYHMPVKVDGTALWHRFRAIDTSGGAYGYAAHIGEADHIETIAQSALDHGIGRRAIMLGTPCHLFPARPLTDHATDWIEQRFNRS